MRRHATLILTILLWSRIVLANDPAPRSRIELATSLELANASRWTESLAVLDQLVITEPKWGEAYFVRAGVLVNIAGDGSTLAALGTLDRKVDYRSIASLLQRSAKDLVRYLELEPNADNRDQVRAAIAAIEARALVARADEQAVAAQVRSEAQARIAEASLAADRLPPPGMNELTRTSRIGLDLTAASMEFVSTSTAAGTLYALTLRLSAAWAILPSVKLTAALPVFVGTFGANHGASAGMFGNHEDIRTLGNLTLGGGWLRELEVAGQPVRFAAGARLSLGTASDTSIERPAARQTGLADPLAFEDGVGVELYTAVRLVRARRFAQAEVAAAYISPMTGSGLAARVALGGGIRTGKSAVLLATLTVAGATNSPYWIGTDSVVSDLRVAVGLDGTTIGLAVPLVGAATSVRGFMLVASYGWSSR